MSKISFEELDGLTGEMLPERSVLSTVVPFNNMGGADAADGGSSSAAAAAAGGGHGGGDQNGIQSAACQSERVHGTPGLTGSLGLGSNNPSSGVTCVPGATSVF
ncbi:hypothetical protein [Streptomyces oceani]|uniref:Uncharacterized protein n=1 Tax=Streptomyces oceani TaxID=1075402 RepID=A0A1E7KLH7_9ACTN|nr:hypothetical protein [Streptomyces oceani]OEV04756.1 hypothetical protein AN216_05590 [Streptomyces oceani]